MCKDTSFQEWAYEQVPAGKAASNICKKYILPRSFDVWIKYYCAYYLDNARCVTVIARHLDYTIPSEIQELPSLYWLPKLCKNPYSAGFIAASHKCTTKLLSTLFTSCLSLMSHYRWGNTMKLILPLWLNTLIVTCTFFQHRILHTSLNNVVCVLIDEHIRLSYPYSTFHVTLPK